MHIQPARRPSAATVGNLLNGGDSEPIHKPRIHGQPDRQRQHDRQPDALVADDELDSPGLYRSPCNAMQRRQPIDGLIDVLLRMRRKAARQAAKASCGTDSSSGGRKA
jgi:hypothetical protein